MLGVPARLQPGGVRRPAGLSRLTDVLRPRLAAATALACVALLLTGLAGASVHAAPADPARTGPPGSRSIVPTTPDPVIDPRSGDVFVSNVAWTPGPLRLSRIDGRTSRVEWTRTTAGRRVHSIQVDAPRRRLVLTGTEWLGDENQGRVSGFVMAQGLDGRELWHRTGLSPGEESLVLGTAVDEGTGQVCVVSKNSTDYLPVGVIPTMRLHCWSAAGRPVFTQAWASEGVGEGVALAIDSRRHRLLVARHDWAGRSAAEVHAFSADGEPLWSHDLGVGLEVRELLVDPRRRRAHVVGFDSEGDVVSVGLDFWGKQRYRTSWRSAGPSLQTDLDATVLPRNGKVVVAASVTSGRLLVQAVEPSGRLAEGSVLRRLGLTDQVLVDPRDGQVLTLMRRGKAFRLEAHSLEGRPLWRHLVPTPSKRTWGRVLVEAGRGGLALVLTQGKKTQIVRLRQRGA